uniref:BACK domain-containing protein n=1 Tax=Knipowitschia caucasica TaxID=637954 RepID=A0AAV2J979_KNICA
MWHQSDVIVSKSMKEFARKFILSHFEEVAACDDFLELTVQELMGFVGDDTLNIRFSEISNKYVKNNVLKNSLVGHFDYRNIVLSGLSTSPRLPEAILLAIGGWSGGNPTNIIEAFDWKANRWVNVTNHQEGPRAYHGAVFLDGLVYCVGGFNRLEQFKWHELPPMYHRRSYVSVTVMHSCIYAIGGFDRALRLNTAEVFNPQTTQWSLIAQMNQQRSDANCATLKIWNSLPEDWTYIAPLTSRRSGVSVIAYSIHIYAVRGFDGVERLRSVEAYNPQTNSWHEVAPMITTRSNFGLESVETYDPLMDRWSEAQANSLFRSALNCCVISGISNMADYAVAPDMIRLLDVDSDENDNYQIYV